MPNPDNIKDHSFDKHPENIGHKPKGAKNRSTILKKWIEVAVKIKDKSNPLLKEVTGTVEDQIILALITKARLGDVQAIKEINDTLYGKIIEKTDHTTDGEKINSIIVMIKRNGFGD